MIRRLSTLSRFSTYNIIFAVTALVIMFLVWIFGFVIPRSHAAVPCSVTYTFVNGTIADAVQVNKNFSDVLMCFAGTAASGVNSDITAITGLTTPLSVPQGGTGDTFITANGVLYGAGTAAINSTAAAPVAGLLSASASSVPTWMGPGAIGSVLAVGGTGFPTWTGVGAAGQVLTSVGAGEPQWASSFSKLYAPITGNYTISSADCGHMLNLSGGYFTLTAGSTGPSSSCDVSFCNADSGLVGKHLVNFPAGFFSTLYPLQCGTLTWTTAGWAATVAPGRWLRSGAAFYVTGISGNDTANDGLDRSRGFATLNHCVIVARDQVYSTQGAPVVCDFPNGVTTDECVSVFGNQQNGAVYLLIQGELPTGGSNLATGWTCLNTDTSGGAGLEVGDMSVVILDNLTIAAESNKVPISLHNPGVFDYGNPSDPLGACHSPNSNLSLQGAAAASLIGSDGNNSQMSVNCNFSWEGAAGNACTALLQAQNGLQVTWAGGLTITSLRACQNLVVSILGATVWFEGPVTWIPAPGNSFYNSMHPYTVWGNGQIVNEADNGGAAPLPGNLAGVAGRTGAYCTNHNPLANGGTYAPQDLQSC